MTATPGPISSQGTTIKKSSGGTAIAFLTSVDGLDIKANTYDVTALDSTGGFKVFINGFKEAGDVAVSGYFDYASHNAILTDLQAGTKTNYTIQFPAAPGGVTGASWTFDAVVSEFKTSAKVDAVVTFDATFKVSGQPSLVAGT